MQPVQKATFKNLPLPSHRTKRHDGNRYLFLQCEAVEGYPILLKHRVEGNPKGSVLTVQEVHSGYVLATSDFSPEPVSVDECDYHALFPYTEPVVPGVTTYSKTVTPFIEHKGMPVMNSGLYDHTVIDMSMIASEGGHTLVLKLPNNQYVTVCIEHENEASMLGITHHGHASQQVIVFDGETEEHVRGQHYCLDIRDAANKIKGA